MTNEEAIKWIENLKQDIGQLRHEDLWPYAQAIDEIIDMLEKKQQIPVKDVQWCEVTRKRMINGICPTCNSIITHFNGSMFCDKCGQAVKWE